MYHVDEMIPAKRRLEESSSDEHQTEAQVSIIREVYQAVWEEFNEWSKKDFEKSMQTLVTKSQNRTEMADDDLVGDIEQLDLQEESFPNYTMNDPEIITLKAPFDPAPSYTSCTPISDNHHTGDDPHDLPFFPLADDPTFDWKEYGKQYKSYAWNSDLFDSDLHAVVTETAHRLHHQHGLSYAEIDDTSELPLPLTSTRNGPPGVLVTLKYQGDFDWANSAKHSSQSENLPLKPVLPVRTEFQNLVSHFCNSASCMFGYCDQHIPWYPFPPRLSVTARKDSNDLLADTLSACSNDCFISRLPGNDLTLETEWTQDDLDTFKIFIDHSPDALPCDLAVICKKPCFEIFKRRKNMLPDDDIKRKDPRTKVKYPPPLKQGKFNDLNMDKFKPGKPCHHKGTCDASHNCTCHRKHAHCDRSCHCDLKACRRRWTGCSCARRKTKRSCRTNECACYKAQRECDPELCGRCGARSDQSERDKCSNVSIQRQYWKHTEVKPGTWGVGLFLLEPVESGEFITEYVGEMTHQRTSLTRDEVSNHRKRSYLYNLNGNYDLDSNFLGNESRYINHSDSPNCFARIMLVTGNYRIGIYAKTRLEPGIELFLDYGSDFFRIPTKAKQ
ncbi:hypothetical protein EV361DRAFT_211843 [Lentinula raphanica]|uniref:SET domain-containing protein n=1 Tax=Lentinula raphanica TaxID=153919 RepID=A0AA38PID0_9AGAR|nr:hypothetical protein F5878DRAFT_283398 [Lentinula raphanica]KAJ3976848.1 hypothetical protein EV361DRAFT_211843 [Lentinula raphanica]